MPQLNDFLYLLTGRWREVLPEPQNNFLLLLLVLGVMLFLPRRAGRLFRPLENAWIHFARRRKAAILFCGFLAFAINAAIAGLGRWPVPAVHDEFSYLLAADTYAHGRLTNPPHPMWVHFETYHVIQQPTYASKYPPGQGLMLAVGQALFGSPVVALWLAAAGVSMAICWMLQQWLKPRWALLGGVLTATYSLLIYWSQSFWGCQLAIIGGALALGGLRLFLDARAPSTLAATRRSSGAWWMGGGMALMILTRPYEGGVLTLLILFTLFGVGIVARKKAAMPRGEIARRATLPRVLMPIGALLIAVVLVQAYYNLRVTHDPLLLPYEQHERTYGVSPLFIWQPFKPEPVYHHPLMRRSHVLEEPPAYLHHRTPAIMLEVAGERGMRLLLLLCQSPALAGALLLLPFVLTRDKQLRLVVAFVLAFCMALMLEVWMLPHYLTPILPALILLCMQALQRLRAWRPRGRPAGLYAMRFLVVLSLLSPFSSFVALARPGSGGLIYTQPGLRDFAYQRARLQQQLEAMPGHQLVIVRYRPTHNDSFEWVYNRADIDHAKVVWARAMNPQQDRALAEYFRRRGHRVWLLDADDTPPRLHAFSPPGTQGGSKADSEKNFLKR
jgi:hypothetical protein